ncbi:MAG TPA: cytidine/deoxycytidylate deaminase family protein [Negativicutes bacterium]|nr:cytidine/deoxycytidylate deaminase family protein [Negativicutes bacterium]
MPKDSRPSWDEYFMDITRVVATRSTCLRRQVGAVIVKDKRLLTSGYNGAPQGLAHCLEAGCLREKMGILSGERHELCRGLHAEQNAIVQAALHGVGIAGSTIYCTHQPCSACAKMIINSGIRRIVFEYPYPDELARDLLNEAGVQCDCFQTKQITTSNESRSKN